MNIMYRVGRYSAHDSMSELICNNYTTLQIVSRYGISLGFGEESIEEVCSRHSIDVKTFLAVVNLQLSEEKNADCVESPESLSALSLVEYLRRSHEYFLAFRFPHIRRKLIAAIADGEEAVTKIILKHYDNYVGEISRHMTHEEQVVFPYVESLANSQQVAKALSIEECSDYHEHVNSKLSELKNILIKYYPAQSTNVLCNVLFDIFVCEEDLSSHAYVEDLLLVPAIKSLQKSREDGSK